MNKYADKPQGLSHTLDGVWQSIQNSGKSGVREWVEKIRNAANVARNLEKRNRELEGSHEQESDTVTVPIELLESLVDVCTWHKSMCNLSRIGETFDMCPDQNSFNFLEGEAESIKARAEQYLHKEPQS